MLKLLVSMDKTWVLIFALVAAFIGATVFVAVFVPPVSRQNQELIVGKWYHSGTNQTLTFAKDGKLVRTTGSGIPAESWTGTWQLDKDVLTVEEPKSDLIRLFPNWLLPSPWKFKVSIDSEEGLRLTEDQVTDEVLIFRRLK